jgi:hypothetical protein
MLAVSCVAATHGYSAVVTVVRRTAWGTLVQQCLLDVACWQSIVRLVQLATQLSQLLGLTACGPVAVGCSKIYLRWHAYAGSQLRTLSL